MKARMTSSQSVKSLKGNEGSS